MKVNLTPILLAYERILRARRSERVCICPSHASNRGECPVHDTHGRVRPGYPIVIEAPHTTASNPSSTSEDRAGGVDA